MCLGMAQGVQTALDGFITCKDCLYGRDVGAGDYGCISQKRRDSGHKLVNKADFSCDYAERGFDK